MAFCGRGKAYHGKYGVQTKELVLCQKLAYLSRFLSLGLQWLISRKKILPNHSEYLYILQFKDLHDSCRLAKGGGQLMPFFGLKKKKGTHSRNATVEPSESLSYARSTDWRSARSPELSKRQRRSLDRILQVLERQT